MISWIKQFRPFTRVIVLGSLALNLAIFSLVAYGIHKSSARRTAAEGKFWEEQRQRVKQAKQALDSLTALAYCSKIQHNNRVPDFSTEQEEIIRLFYQAMDFSKAPPKFYEYYVFSVSDVYYTGDERHKGEGIYTLLLEPLDFLQLVSMDSVACALYMGDPDRWYIVSQDGKILNQGDWHAVLDTRLEPEAPWPFARRKCADGTWLC